MNLKNKIEELLTRFDYIFTPETANERKPMEDAILTIAKDFAWKVWEYHAKIESRYNRYAYNKTLERDAFDDWYSDTINN